MSRIARCEMSDGEGSSGTFELDIMRSIHIAMLYNQENAGGQCCGQTCIQVDR
jgi:hypothetical protein